MKFPIAAAAAFAFGVVHSASFAQQDPAQEDPYANPPTEESAPGAPLNASGAEIVGQSVYDSNGRKIGRIEGLAVAQDGTEVAVISVGGFLGMGAKKVAVATMDLTPYEDGSGFSIPASVEEIEAAPEFEGPPEE